MRIVIDLQAGQGNSRNRGIGRYSISLAKAMIRNGKNHEIILLLSGLLPETISDIQREFENLIPITQMKYWTALSPVYPASPNPDQIWRRKVSELMREAFVASLNPDIVYIASMVEGWDEDIVSSVNRLGVNLLTAATFYDVIPLMNPEQYLRDSAVKKHYEEKIEHLKQVDTLLAISESSKQEASKYLDINPNKVFNIGAGIENIFQKISLDPKKKVLLQNKYGFHKPFIMYSGATDERKNHLRLIEAFSILPEEIINKYHLIFVGGLPEGHRKLFEQARIACGLNQEDLIITGRVSDDELVMFYNLCDLFVFPSWHEGFGLPVLEAMSCGAPVIGSNTTSIPEVIGRDDVLFDPFNVNSIAKKIEEVLQNDKMKSELSEYGLKQCKNFSWDLSAQAAISALEKVYEQHSKNCTKKAISNKIIQKKLIHKISLLDNYVPTEKEVIKVSSLIASNHSFREKKQFLIDISVLRLHDAATGIQRVVRSILIELLHNIPIGYEVEPVYAHGDAVGYYYARSFKNTLLNLLDDDLVDEPIEVYSGDIFLGLDLQQFIVANHSSYYQEMRNKGAKVYFIVYDILPILMPELFPEWVYDAHTQWLNELANNNGIVCISKSVADDVYKNLSFLNRTSQMPLNIGWFHLGADIESSMPSIGMPISANKIVEKLSKNIVFLMVGTIEPRKGHLQTFRAFEQLWSEGMPVSLVIVGKEGWNQEHFVDLVANHQELGHKLFWLENISDEYLEKVYAVSSCLISASEGEGFGLPLIEAAQYKIPMILRDIPVFREVAGEYAYYFSDDKNPEILASAIKEWLTIYRLGNYPKSDKMPYLTWKESSEKLLKIVLEDQWYQKWIPDEAVSYFSVGDSRLRTQVGKRVGKHIKSTGESGYLMFGPYISIAPGQYEIKVLGMIDNNNDSPETYIDFAANRGMVIFEKKVITESYDEECITVNKIVVDKVYDDFEVRLFVDSEVEVVVSLLKITLIDDES